MEAKRLGSSICVIVHAKNANHKVASSAPTVQGVSHGEKEGGKGTWGTVILKYIVACRYKGLGYEHLLCTALAGEDIAPELVYRGVSTRRESVEVTKEQILLKGKLCFVSCSWRTYTQSSPCRAQGASSCCPEIRPPR